MMPNRPYDPGLPSGYYSHNPQAWEDAAVPQTLREWDDSLISVERTNNTATTISQFFNDLVSSIPVIGGIAKAFSALGIGIMNRSSQQWANERNRFNASYANWYNSPAEQMRRLRKAGINPFTQGQAAVKSMPAAIPDYQPYISPYPQGSSESLAGLINAVVNAGLAPYRAENLDSLTAINQYKEQYLFPQLFEKNGYLNSILQLQEAWETGNYEKERQLKQNLLTTNYELALIDTAKGLMETSARIPGSYVKVDPANGTLVVQIPDNDGNMVDYDLNDLPFDKLPPVLQQSLVNIWQTKQITTSKVELNKIIGNTQSALGGLYNSQRVKVDIYTNEYKEHKVWPDEDITVRYAAGMLDSNTYWANFGLNSVNKVFDAGLDIGSAYLNPRVLLKNTGTQVPASMPLNPQSTLTPQPLKIPRGATPYTVNGQTYWYYK